MESLLELIKILLFLTILTSPSEVTQEELSQMRAANEQAVLQVEQNDSLMNFILTDPSIQTQADGVIIIDFDSGEL